MAPSWRPTALTDLKKCIARTSTVRTAVEPSTPLQFQINSHDDIIHIQLNEAAFIHILKACHVFWNEEGDPIGNNAWMSGVLDRFGIQSHYYVRHQHYNHNFIMVIFNQSPYL